VGGSEGTNLGLIDGNTPAKMLVKLNDKVVWGDENGNAVDLVTGDTNIVGTGSRGKDPAKYPALSEGYIYIQSHWGNQVEFKPPVITGMPID